MHLRSVFRAASFPVMLFVLMIFGGAFVYVLLEGWSYIDALYFVVITATTVGYGDIVPVTLGGKVFTMFYAFSTIGLAFYFFTLMGKYFFTKRLKKEMFATGRFTHDRGTRVVKT